MFSQVKVGLGSSFQTISLNGNTVIINGQNYSKIKEIILVNTDVQTSVGKYENVTIQVEGNVSSLSTASADVVVMGKVHGSVSTASGDVECGDVEGNINTMSGDVDCGRVSGSITTMSGNIKQYPNKR